jgi:non-specific serine/threonine protein kinase/serine/threonine-protein kinase
MKITPERWKQVKELLCDVIEMDPTRRSAYLEHACGDDISLKHEVQRLLAAQESAGPAFMKEPALEVLNDDGPPQQGLRIGQVLGSYKLISVIGEGGMGEVYRGTRADDEYQRQVAIKLVQVGKDFPSVISRFRNERQILANLDHPNIARLHDGGTTVEGAPYFVMELIDGERIDQYCDHETLNVEARLKLFLQVCSAVQFAHRRLIVHRDIKPSNILVTREGVPKLLDFGIAKILDPGSAGEVDQTAMSLRVFTPAYASPEQVRGEPITTATDVYSLGVVLYELLVGRHPYRLALRTPEALSRAICECEPERPSTAIRRTDAAFGDRNSSVTPEAVGAVRGCSPEKLRKRLAGDLDKIVLMALRKEPERRYGSVEQFAEDIRRHLAKLPVCAHGDALGYRASKFVNRHRAGIASVAVASLALIVGTVVSVREARIARAERARAERRFNDVRKLANSLLFDVHDAIRDLPGSTAARKVLLDKALEYLDGLSGEAGNDPALQRELATAYERVAEVQGHFLNNNLGDTGGSLRSYQKALVLRQQLVATPGNTWQDRLALANSSRAVGSELLATGDASHALDAVRKAIATSESLHRERPTDTRVMDELAYDYEIEGHVEGGEGFMGVGLGDPTEVMRSYRSAVEIEEAWLRIAPNETSALHSYETDLLFLADSLKSGGSVQEALADYGHALEIATIVSQRTGSARRLRDVAVAHNRLAELYETERDWRRALSSDQQALEIYRQLVARDPNDFIMKQGLAIALANVGLQKERITPNSGLSGIHQGTEMMEKIVAINKENAQQRGIVASMYLTLGDAFKIERRFADALREYQKALRVYEKLYAGDPNNTDALDSIAVCKASVGGVLLNLEQTSAASQSFSEALAAIDPALATPRPSEDVLHTAADSYNGLAEVELQLADRSRSNPAAQRAHWERARNFYVRSLDAFQRVPPSLQGDPRSSELCTADRVREKVELYDGLLGKAELAMKHQSCK